MTGKKEKKKYTVSLDEDFTESVDVLAKHIKLVSEAFQKVGQSELNQKALILLIQGITGMSQGDIKKVLDACVVLKSVYIKEHIRST